MDRGRLIVDNSGSKIARLHARPSTSDLTVGDEVNRKFCGSIAREAASKYQAEHGPAQMRITGERGRW